MYQISGVLMHVCQATILDYKSAGFGILDFFPDFWEKKIWKLARFLSENSTFRCSTKI
jgi:hypothetical protein